MSEEHKPDDNKNANNRRGRNPVIWILIICFIVSLFSFIIYLTDADFSDETIFNVLSVMWYSSFMVCVCSLYKLIEGIYYFFIRRSSSRAMKTIPYIIFIIYGLFLIFLESLIVVISEGNI